VDEAGAKEEAPGFAVYGLGDRNSMEATSVRCLPEGWRVSIRYLIGENWKVAVWTVAVPAWPSGDRWKSLLSSLMSEMVSAGAKVVWVGDETTPYVDPPDLFKWEFMEGAVFAWLTDNGVSGGFLDPDRPLVPASGEDLRKLRSYARGLADAE
jgi:hypothetical protein